MKNEVKLIKNFTYFWIKMYKILSVNLIISNNSLFILKVYYKEKKKISFKYL